MGGKKMAMKGRKEMDTVFKRGDRNGGREMDTVFKRGHRNVRRDSRGIAEEWERGRDTGRVR